jgi:hypothetical protein
MKQQTWKDSVLDLFSDVEAVTESGLNTTEHIFLTLAARLAPWLAPLGPAILIYRALQHTMQINPLAAGAMGAAVELVGIATSHLTVNCWQWNQTRRKSDPKAPTGIAAAMTGIYLVGAVAVSTILEIYPESAPYAPIVFFLLAACAYGSLALGSQLNRWQALRRDEQAARRGAADLRLKVAKLTEQSAKLTAELNEARRENSALKTAKPAADREPVALRNGNPGFPIDQARTVKANKVKARRAELMSLTQQNPDLSPPQLAEILAVSADTVRRDLRALNGQVTHASA